MIHGEHPDRKTGDWTAGCIALSNEDITRLAALVHKGEPVQITACPILRIPIKASPCKLSLETIRHIHTFSK